MQNDIKFNDLPIPLREYIVDQISILHSEISALHTKIDILQAKKTKTEKSEFNSTVNLEQAKQAFATSAPHDRTDPLNNWELVLWASYVLKDTNRRDIIASVPEIAKRATRVQNIIDYYKKILIEKGIEEKEADIRARCRTKDFLEFVLLSYPKVGNNPMTFYIATSPWAINNFGSKVGSWQQIKSIEDTAPEDNE